MKNNQPAKPKSNPLLWLILALVVLIAAFFTLLCIKFDLKDRIFPSNITLDSLKTNIFSKDVIYIDVNRSLYEDDNLIAEVQEEMSYTLNQIPDANLITDFTAKVYQKVRPVTTKTDYGLFKVQYDPKGLFVEWQKIFYRHYHEYGWARSNKSELYMDNYYVDDQKYHFLPVEDYVTLRYISDLKEQHNGIKKQKEGFQIFTFTPIYQISHFYDVPDKAEVYVKDKQLKKILFIYNRNSITDVDRVSRSGNYRYTVEIIYSDTPTGTQVPYKIESQYNSDQWVKTDFDTCHLSFKSPRSWKSYIQNYPLQNNSDEFFNYQKPSASLTLYEPYLTSAGTYSIKTISSIHCQQFNDNISKSEQQEYITDYHDSVIPLKNEFNYDFNHQIDGQDCNTRASLEKNNSNSTVCVYDNHMYSINPGMRATDPDYKLYKEILAQTLKFQ